jgi:hypothetical protein
MAPPTAAALAGPEPEMPPRNMLTITVTAARDPALRPMRACAKLTRRRATPERSKIAPTSTNIGTASSGYFAMPV